MRLRRQDNRDFEAAKGGRERFDSLRSYPSFRTLATRILLTQGLYSLMTEEERRYFWGLELCSIYRDERE